MMHSLPSPVLTAPLLSLQCRRHHPGKPTWPRRAVDRRPFPWPCTLNIARRAHSHVGPLCQLQKASHSCSSLFPTHFHLAYFQYHAFRLKVASNEVTIIQSSDARAGPARTVFLPLRTNVRLRVISSTDIEHESTTLDLEGLLDLLGRLSEVRLGLGRRRLDSR